MDWFSNDDLKEMPDIEPLLKALGEEEIAKVENSYGKTVLKISKSYRKEVLDNLYDIAFLEGSYTASVNKFLLTAVRMLMPDEIPNAVILDATANQNIIYDLLGDFAEIKDVPDNVRDYSNVTLNVLYGLPVGKKSLNVVDEDTLSVLYQNHFSHLHVSETLYCVHKINRDKFEKVIAGLNDDNLAHWGAIDGKDEWANLANIFICGLPYMGQLNAENINSCLQNWMENDGWQYNWDKVVYHDNYDDRGNKLTPSVSMPDPPDWQDYERSHIAVSVIQAINRICCRRVVDKNGGCANANIYLCLGKKDGNQSEYQNHLISEIKMAMPNVKIQETLWHTSENDQLSSHEQLFIDILRSLESGDHSAMEVMASANSKGISITTVRRFQKAIVGGEESEFVKQVRGMGCTYISERGKYAKSIYRKI